jgi:hypothetical protein
MEPVSEDEWFHNPSSMAEWEEMRLAFLPAEKQRGGKTTAVKKNKQDREE